MNLDSVLLVGAGGALGSVARYLIGRTIDVSLVTAAGFPFGVLVVNAVGCLVIGILGGLAHSHGILVAGTGVRLFLFVGILGGFTTFSAFGYDTYLMARDGYVLIAAGYVVLSVVTSLAAVWLGFRLGGV